MQRQQDLLEAVLDSIEAGVVACDADGVLTLFNRAAREFHGVPAEAVPAEQWAERYDLYLPDGRTRMEVEQIPLFRALRGEHVHNVEMVIAPKNGVTRTLLASGRALRDRHGRQTGAVAVMHDISERKRAERALLESEERYRNLVEASPEAILVNRGNRFIFANSAALRLFGVASSDQLLGKSPFEVFHPDYHSQIQARIEQLLTARSVILCEEKIVRPDGVSLDVEVTTAPFSDEQGRAILVMLRDITERKRAEHELSEYREHLEELVAERTADLKQANARLAKARDAAEGASRAKSTFLANMSHEIRTPLNAVIGMTELVLKSQLSAQQREFLATVRDSGEALLSVINDILDFSKIEAGKLVLDQSSFDLRESLGDTMKSFALRAHQQGLELACFVHPDVPRRVVGDYNRLRQIVVNLVGNAVKFTQHGEVVLEVTQQSRAVHQVLLHFTIGDTGPGISPETQAVIFEMFEQGDSSMTRRHGGTGLGLAISSRLIELMGGRIWVDSGLGCGSRFHFLIPLEVDQDEPVEAEPPEPAVLHGMPVLVVDDNATNRRILEATLRSWQMVPTTAADAAEAFRLLLQARELETPYRLVLTDAHMPSVDGFRLAEQIQQHPALDSTVVMMLTSGDHPEDASRCKQLNFAAYLLKPIKQSELLEAIQQALEIPAAAPTRPAPEEPPPLPPLRILLAEDSLVNQKLAVALLESQGHQVTLATNGLEAVSAAADEPFDLILMDVQMPEMDGLEATREIRARERQTGTHTPILAMTAHALKGARERCLESGMDGYVPKPIRARELFDTIATFVNLGAP